MGDFENRVFKKGSKTYYNSSAFFSKQVREDVAKFYSFVRVVDDYVDSIPPDTKSFFEVKDAFEKNAKLTGDKQRILDNINYIISEYKLPRSEVDAFMRSMEMDSKITTYNTIEDTLHYIYGSAEVIGIGMAKILGLKEAATDAAKMQGRAMQYINFLRDIDEDNNLGRQYFPRDILNSFNLNDLTAKTATKQPREFTAFISQEIHRYQTWQSQAAKGYKYIPYRPLIAIKTASDMYGWTAKQIMKNPMLVFEKKVKPSKRRIKLTALKNGVVCLRYIRF